MSHWKQFSTIKSRFRCRCNVCCHLFIVFCLPQWVRGTALLYLDGFYICAHFDYKIQSIKWTSWQSDKWRNLEAILTGNLIWLPLKVFPLHADVSISSKSLFLPLASLKMPRFSVCPISNAKLFLHMCGHTYVSKTKAGKDEERAQLNEPRIKWGEYLQRDVRDKGCHRKAEGEQNRKMCWGNQLYLACSYLLHPTNT